MENFKSLKEKFKNPSKKYRSAPLWAWNDKLDTELLVYQVNEMKEKGMGGFFMHSREGLETVYMGREWMKCVKETVRAAKETGMEAWIYDEDRWPSGAAGGLVTAKGGDAFRAKAVTLEVIKGEFECDEKVLALFEAIIDNNHIQECKRLNVTEKHTPEKGRSLLIFRREVSKASEWFNDDSPADNLNPDSVKAFIETTYEKYKENIGDEFGRTVPGIFTDEPNIADNRSIYTGNRGWIPWTDGFVEYFHQKRGYVFLDTVPFIFFKGKKSSKVRHDYWRTISERFCEAYSKQLGEWCDKNNLAFTGHYLCENKMGNAARVSGSIMPHYRYQHIPGIDRLCEQTNEIITVKQCTSVANQYGRKRVLSESYGCSGWDFNFEGQKWVGDWQYVMGINFRSQHHALYSLRGCRKRDYPPTFNYNTSWWKYNNIVEDYFARIAAVMSQGEVVRDVLVIHPLSTIWSILGSDVKSRSGFSHAKTIMLDSNVIKANNFSRQFDDFIKHLLDLHYDFDLGDEIIMEEEGRVENGEIYINAAGYSVVIIPSLKTLFKSTLKLLEGFMSEGGKVIAVEPLATMIEGEGSDELSKLYKNKNMIIIKHKRDICEVPRKVSIRNSTMRQAPEFLYMLKDLPDCQSLFIVNNARNNSYNVTVSVACVGLVEEWNLLTGEVRDITVKADKDRVSFESEFGASGSRLYIIRKKKLPKIEGLSSTGKLFGHHSKRKIYTALGPVCKFTRTVPNVLVVDKCFFRINDGNWAEETDVWKAQREIRGELGMRQVCYHRLPQRYKWVDRSHPKDGTLVEFMFHINVRYIPEKDIFLVLEMSKNYDIKLNGNNIPNEPNGWFIDKAFDKIKLSGIKQGKNELVLSCKYLNSMEVEDCYIIGDFGVDAQRNIIKESETIHIGDWCFQGYFHYCGSMIYHFNFNHINSNERTILELGDYRAVTVEVRVNESTAGHIPWRSANSLDITGFLKQGNNKIDIEVMSSPRNLFGPLHKVNTTDLSTSYLSFRTEGEKYTPEYIVKPYGLLGQINIYKE